MKQIILVFTCDKCGIQQKFEITNINANGPIVHTTEISTMLSRHRLVSYGDGLRKVDLCGICEKSYNKRA